MSTAKMPVVMEKTEFAYNNLGLVARTSNDQNETYSCYYPAQATSDDAAPDLSTVLGKFTLADETALADALNLTCPVVPDTRQPPLRGLLQRVRAPDGRTLSANLTLFGYHLATHNNKGVLTPNTVLSLEHISVNTATTPWTISKATGVDGLRVTLQQNTPAPNNAGSIQTITNWYKNNSTRVTHILREQFKYDPATLTHFSRTTTTLHENGQELTPVLAQQVRSALSGLVLRETRQDEHGQPVTEVQRSYDIRGRDVGSFVNNYNAATFIARVTERNQGHSVQRLETGNGTWVIVRGPDGRCGRTLYDGLQRPVRYELQRIPNDNHSTQNYCLIQEVRYDASGQVIEQTLYDYLPGGLRRRQRNAQMPANMKDWFWQGEKSSSTTNAVGDITQITERTLSSRKHGTQLSVRQTLTTHADGRFSEHQQQWTGQESVERNHAIDTRKKLDTYGRVVELAETLPNADGSRPEAPTRVWRMEYDNLNRKSKQHCPDGMSIEYDYQGYATSPVKLTVRKGDEVRVLASRTLKSDGLQGEQITSMTRGQGPNAAALTYAYQDRGTTLPDDSKIVSEISADGESVAYFVEQPASTGTPAKKTLLVSFKRAPIAHAIIKERHDAGDSQRYNSQLVTSAKMLGTHSTHMHTRDAGHRHVFQRSLLGEVEHVSYASNVHRQVWRDSNGLVRRARRGCVEYLYDYSALGELKQIKVQGTSAEYDLEMNCAYDAFGHEASREYLIAGKPVVRHERNWSAAGQLLSKSVYRNGATSPSSTQTYTYDRLRGWLLSWSIDAIEGDQILDSTGNVITAQSYQYDLIDNLTQCRTVRGDGTVETRDYTYHTHYSTRRERVTTTLHDKTGKQTSQKTVQLSYDTNGNLSANEQGQILTYTVTGRLASVSDSTGLLTTYEYDADDRLIGQWNNATKQRMMLAYNGDRLCMETWLDDKGAVVKRRILDDQAALVVQVFESSNEVTQSRTLFNLVDPHDGGGDQYQFAQDGQCKRTGITFSPWGEASLDQLNDIDGLGFNGQRVDPVTGCYHLGNGYRTYDPGEKRFQQPDAWSPFGLGGLNDRAYCAGDPVNWHDPSGHFMISRQGAASQLASLDEMIRDTAPPVHERAAWWEWALLGVFFVVGVVAAIMTGGAMMVFLLTILVVSAALDAASLATRHTNPRLSAKLGYAALAVGFVDIAVAGVKKLGQTLAWALRRAKQLRHAIKFRSVTSLFQKSRKYAYRMADNAEDMSDIGSSASKTRASGARKLDPLNFDQFDGLVDDSSGITALRQNADGAYAMVNSSKLSEAIVKNASEIKKIGKTISRYRDIAENFREIIELSDELELMGDDAKSIEDAQKVIAQQHQQLNILKKQHANIFAEIVQLKDTHEKTISPHAWVDPATSSRPLDAPFKLDPCKADELHTSATFDLEVFGYPHELPTLNHENQILFHQEKQQTLIALNKKIDGSTTSIVTNNCAAQYGEAFDRLKEINKAIASQEDVVHSSLAQQLTAYKRIIESSSKLTNLVKEQPEQSNHHQQLMGYQKTMPVLTQAARRSNILDHFKKAFLSPGDAQHPTRSARQTLKVSTGATQTTTTVLEHVERTLDDGKVISELISRQVPKTLKATLEYWSAEKLNEELTKTGFNPRQFDDVKLVMCCGTSGHNSSFAQRFAYAADTQVKTYTGGVTTVGFLQKINSSYATSLSNRASELALSSQREGNTVALFDTAAEKAASVHVVVAKHYQSSILSEHAHTTQFFSPIQELAD